MPLGMPAGELRGLSLRVRDLVIGAVRVCELGGRGGSGGNDPLDSPGAGCEFGPAAGKRSSKYRSVRLSGWRVTTLYQVDMSSLRFRGGPSDRQPRLPW
jgi:hypothetical protein